MIYNRLQNNIRVIYSK